jgi:hypothetical protein
VATGHLVADRQLALDRDVDLHQLDDARRQLVALLQALDLRAKRLVDLVFFTRIWSSCSRPLLDLAAELDLDASSVVRDLRASAS